MSAPRIKVAVKAHSRRPPPGYSPDGGRPPQQGRPIIEPVPEIQNTTNRAGATGFHGRNVAAQGEPLAVASGERLAGWSAPERPDPQVRPGRRCGARPGRTDRCPPSVLPYVSMGAPTIRARIVGPESSTGSTSGSAGVRPARFWAFPGPVSDAAGPSRTVINPRGRENHRKEPNPKRALVESTPRSCPSWPLPA